MGASERDERRRAEWRRQVEGIEPQKLVFVDACATNTALASIYARSPTGERAYGKAPRNYGKNLTLIASISTTGMGDAMTLEGAAAGDAFEAYVESLLCPSLVCR